MRTEPLSEEEMTARLREAFKANPRPGPEPVLAAANGKEVAHAKPIAARLNKGVIDAAIAHNNELARYLLTAAYRGVFAGDLSEWQQSVLVVERVIARQRSRQ